MTLIEQIEHNKREIEKLKAKIADPTLTGRQRGFMEVMKQKLINDNRSLVERLRRSKK